MGFYVSISSSQNHQVKAEMNFVASVYRVHLKKRYKEKTKLKKIALMLYDDENVLTVGDPSYDIVGVAFSFDFKKYHLSSLEERRMLTLNVIHKAVLEIAQRLKWNQEIFEEIKSTVIESQFQFSFLAFKRKLSPSKNYEAQLRLNLTEEYGLIELLLWKTGETEVFKTIPVFKTIAWDFAFYDLISAGKWINKNCYSTQDKRKEISFIISIENGNVELHFTPKQYSEFELRKKVAQYSYSQPNLN